jgi:hypothetical protein
MVKIIIFITLILMLLIIVFMLNFNKSKHKNTNGNTGGTGPIKPIKSVLAGKIFAMNSLTGICGPEHTKYKFCGQFWKYRNDGIAYYMFSNDDDGNKGMNNPDFSWRYNIYKDLVTTDNITTGIQYSPSDGKTSPIIQTYKYFKNTGVLIVTGPDGATAQYYDTNKIGFYYFDPESNVLYCNDGKTISNVDGSKTSIDDLTKMCQSK